MLENSHEKAFHGLFSLGFGVTYIKFFPLAVGWLAGVQACSNLIKVLYSGGCLGMAEGLFSLTHNLQYQGWDGSHLNVSLRPVRQNRYCQISLLGGISYWAELLAIHFNSRSLLWTLFWTFSGYSVPCAQRTVLGSVHPGELRTPISIWPVSKPLKQFNACLTPGLFSKFWRPCNANKCSWGGEGDMWGQNDFSNSIQ